MAAGRTGRGAEGGGEGPEPGSGVRVTSRRIALVVEYDGRAFCGWERQPHCESVQAAVERALSRVADEPVRVTCAGRTDSGVHALGQVVHFDTRAARLEDAWRRGANSNLAACVAVVGAREVPGDFHARFSARWRHYRYLLLNRPDRPAVLHGRVAWDRRPLDLARIRAAAVSLVGTHDFSAYRASACQAPSPVRTVYALDVQRRGAQLRFDVVADGFLHRMVRNIVGVLLAVGAGEAEPEWAREVLESRDRKQGGVTARAEGLYLVRVGYSARFSLPVVLPDSGVW